MCCCWKPRHVDADLGDDDRRGGRSNPRNLIKPQCSLLKGGQLGFDSGVKISEIGCDLVDPA
jgi:hypothetical protein